MALLGNYHLGETIPERSALTDLVVEKYADEQPLAGVTALLFQHQLSNQVSMTKALIRLGLEPKRIHWVDIPYTSHARVREALQGLGIPALNFRTCDDFMLLDAYALYQRRRAAKVIGELLEQDPEHLLVLDDGAYFLEALSCFERRFRRCAIVEQTSRGFKKLNKNASMRALLRQVPLVNVALSAVKSKLESPFIGAAVCSSLAHHLKGRLPQPPAKARCLVLGYGHIGSAVSDFLVEALGIAKEHVRVADPRIERGEIESDLESWQRSGGGRFDLVIGCTGTTSFDVGDAVFLNDGAVLASASSGAMEFNRRNLVEWAAVSDLDDLEIGVVEHSNLHDHIPVHFPGRDVTLLNGGFPVNFDGRICCVPDQYIQITMALMVQAAVQAVRSSQPGEQMLDKETCVELVEAFYEELGEGAEWLPEKGDVLTEVKKQAVEKHHVA